MPNLFSRLLSRGADKQLKEFEQITAQVNDLEPKFQAMSDDELRGQTQIFRDRYAAGESLDDLLPEAFAAMREASVRTVGMRHFDVQIIGAIALHRGMIAEMKTGEGKTLVSTLAGYLNAIAGEGVHIVTVNDYLAKRDSEWMGQIYKFMGMSVGLLQNGMKLGLKKPAYAADVTYGTNSEFGFDYLRDNMVGRANMRRGRLDPHRRGQDPAHHLRRGHEVGEHLQGLRPRGARPHARGRLRDGRGQAHDLGDRQGPQEDRGVARR